jgi:LmbE family N-acetylglucosaminyl deacetylase
VNDAAHPKILLVEDDEVGATLAIELLETLGEVHWLTTAEQAVEDAARRDWDLMVSDIDLPGIDGLELVRRVKERRPRMAVLILSGHSSFEHAVSALRSGADDYLTKPFDPAELHGKARTLIELTRERRAAGLEVVLAVGAHPDDVEIGIGGILLRHAAQHHRVTVLTLTGGEAGGRSAERAAESQRAAELMHARLIHAALPDTSVSEGAATISTIVDVVSELQPTILYTHTGCDVHQDHRNAHSATLVAGRGVPRVFCYQAPSTTVEFQPTRFVAVDEFLDAKIEVIQAYTSQVKVRRYLDEELLRATARYWARFSHARYVEPLEVVRDSDATPVPSVRSEPARLPEEAFGAG